MVKYENIKILLVEDNKEFANSLLVTVGKYFKMDYVDNLEDALAAIQNNHYDVVITDGAFPEKKGYSIGSHGHLRDEDYRGNIVARAAKAKKSYVIGVSMESHRLKEPDLIIEKGKLSILDLIGLIKKKFNLE